MPEKKKELTIRQKLCYVQANLKAAKGQFNAFGKYNYRSCEDILEALKPLLAKVEAAVTLTDDVVITGDWHYIKAVATIDDDNGEVFTTAYAREPEIKKGMDASQITGTASSYARKYALNGLFCIDDTKDSDATNKHGKGENGSLTEPAKYHKPETPPAETITAKAKEAAKKELEAKIDELIGLSFFEFQTVHTNEMPDGKIFSKEFFKNEVRNVFAKLTPKAKKAFVWDLTSVNRMAEQVLPVNCLADIKVNPDA